MAGDFYFENVNLLPMGGIVQILSASLTEGNS